MGNYKKVNLRSIILDYAKSQNITLDNEDQKRSYVKDRTREIKELCKCLNLNLEQFQDRDKKTYAIPYDVATVISVYLRQPSCRGSAISKMKAGNYSQITDEEKINIFEDLITSLKANAHKENDSSLLMTINYLEEQHVGVIKHNERRKDAINQIVGSVNNIIKRAVNAVVGLDDSAGLMVYYNGRQNDEYSYDTDYKLEHKVKEGNRIEIDKFETYTSKAEKYQSNFNYDDQLELVKHLKTVMMNAVMEWTEIVDIAHELRKDDIIIQCTKNIEDTFSDTDQMSMDEVNNEINYILDNILSSEELVQLSINEYNESKKLGMMKTEINKNNMDSVKKLLDKQSTNLNK